MFLKELLKDNFNFFFFFCRPTGGSKHQSSIMTSQNIHLKSHTGKYTTRSMESNSGSGEPKNSIWEERCVYRVVKIEVTHYTSVHFYVTHK